MRRGVASGLLFALLMSSFLSFVVLLSSQTPFTLELLVESPESGELVVLSEADRPTWFNYARCECGSQSSVGLRITLASAPEDGDADLEVWVGPDCDEARNDCGNEPVAELSLSAANPTGEVEFPASELIGGPGGACSKTIEKKRTIWVVERTDSGERAEKSASISDIPVDTKPPPSLKMPELFGAENRLVVRWDKSAVDLEELVEIQALCAEHVGGAPITIEETITQKYMRPADICDVSTDGSGIEENSPDYLCGTASADAEELEISLGAVDPFTEVRVRLLGIDPSGNFVVVTPKPEHAHAVASDDFWEIYKEYGGTASSGCSAVGGEPSALILFGLLLLFFKRRRIAAIVLLASSSTIAFAEPQPKTKWGFGIEVGPHYPGIDSEFPGAEKGPFETVFGKGSAVFVQLKIERYYAWPIGQLGVGLGAGYSEHNAKACLAKEGETKQDCSTRSPVDKTKFRLVPLSVFGVYRFSWLADHDVVPLAPYLRLGLTAQYWAVRGGDGETSGEGFSFAPLGALGISVRLDELEPAASRRLRQELGVAHVGLSGEVSSSALPLFAPASSLRVGATTWSAGLWVEF